ncbi:MAG: hypothetical protein VX341_14100 [Bdellovibrionota bacterium]|nr:hypothetical protein [Bdellovibrionota bacterium]
MFKELIGLILLFTISFYSSHYFTNVDNNIDYAQKKNSIIVEEKLNRLPATKNKRTDSSQIDKKENIIIAKKESLAISVKREPASINTSRLVRNSSSKESQKNNKKANFSKINVSVLSDDNVSVEEKIELLKDRRINFNDHKIVKKILVEEIMGISFVKGEGKKEEVLEITDMKEYLESVSPTDEEVYFFELYNQLASVLVGDELRETSLDLYERVPNHEAKSLVVLHLLDNDTQGVNLNYLLENLSKDQVLSHIPDNYIIELKDNENHLSVYDGPIFEEELESDTEIVEDRELNSSDERNI